MLSADVDPSSTPDPFFTDDDDGDGLTNSEEVQAGTNPTRADTDGDMFSDGEELKAPSLTGMHQSDPLDPNSVPEPVTEEERAACDAAGGELEIATEGSCSEAGDASTEEEQPIIPMCGAKVEQVPHADADLYGIGSNNFGSGILFKPCKEKYYYCFANNVPAGFGVIPENSAILSLQMWLGAARECLTDCPPISKTQFFKTTDCSKADLKIKFIGDRNVCWGGVWGEYGKGFVDLANWTDFTTFLHEVGHASGFHHSDLRVKPFEGAYCPIMSYSNPQPNCLHPLDSRRACRLAAQAWGRTRNDGEPGRVCGQKEECCVDPKTASVTDSEKGYRRPCWPVDKDEKFILDEFGKPPEGEPTYTACTSEKNVCTQCSYKDKNGNTRSWSIVPVPETNPAHPYYGYCKLALFCADPDKEDQNYYPGYGYWYVGKWVETKDGQGEVISRTLSCR